MKYRKIRGQKRRHKTIDRWVNDAISFDLVGCLPGVGRYHTKIGVSPWNGMTLTNSIFAEPTGKTKQQMLKGLLDVYECWKTQLDTFDQPYYLKLWLFEPRFSRSQVVCAIGDSLNFYDDTFFKPDTDRTLRYDNYGALGSRLEKLHWDYRFDEEHFDACEISNPEVYTCRQEYEDAVLWFRKLLRKPHRIAVFEKPGSTRMDIYSIKHGEVWIGGR